MPPALGKIEENCREREIHSKENGKERDRDKEKEKDSNELSSDDKSKTSTKGSPAHRVRVFCDTKEADL